MKEDFFDKMMRIPALRKMQPFYKKYKEQLLYLFFGGCTFLVSIFSYAIVNKGFGINELVANVISWVLAVIFAFFTNRIWVFQSPTEGFISFLRQMLNFFAGRLATLGVEELIILIFITILGWNSMVIKAIAQIIVIILNYVISKIWIFKDRR